jgi:hypothetical protein
MWACGKFEVLSSVVGHNEIVNRRVQICDGEVRCCLCRVICSGIRNTMRCGSSFRSLVGIMAGSTEANQPRYERPRACRQGISHPLAPPLPSANRNLLKALQKTNRRLCRDGMHDAPQGSMGLSTHNARLDMGDDGNNSPKFHS